MLWFNHFSRWTPALWPSWPAGTGSTRSRPCCRNWSGKCSSRRTLSSRSPRRAPCSEPEGGREQERRDDRKNEKVSPTPRLPFDRAMGLGQFLTDILTGKLVFDLKLIQHRCHTFRDTFVSARIFNFCEKEWKQDDEAKNDQGWKHFAEWAA